MKTTLLFLQHGLLVALTLVAIIQSLPTGKNKLGAEPTLMDLKLMLNDVGYPAGLGSKKRSGLKSEFYRWPNKEVIYTIDETFTDEERKVILEAMDYISSKTCIRFKERTTEFARVNIKRGGGPSSCFSFIGRLGIPQAIWLRPPSDSPFLGHCVHLAVVAHELIHTIGFDHEHSRPDRDDFVEIKWDNIDVVNWIAFFKLPASLVDDFNVPYDYSSIMHYPAYGFSKNPFDPQPAMVPKQNGVTLGGTVITDGDALKINRMYGCAS